MTEIKRTEIGESVYIARDDEGCWLKKPLLLSVERVWWTRRNAKTEHCTVFVKDLDGKRLLIEKWYGRTYLQSDTEIIEACKHLFW